MDNHLHLLLRLDSQGAQNWSNDDLSSLTSDPAQEVELWLLPLEDLRAQGSSRAGMVEGCTFSLA